MIDEAWRLWPAGTRANAMLEQHKSFLAEHRHMVSEDGRSTEVVIVTQDLSQLASYPRSLVALRIALQKWISSARARVSASMCMKAL
ncbi:hypothetical protein G3T16_20745 [Kineobactrum salinum]|uniref:Uncharacterized protein n=1 Tax=Kineobactrum salinum TaxID=2708301 RepID=A0A6C0UBK0_9GAMM|nr:hypothetical protein G3T16_20745 [Kineobactrum salinum]